MKTDPYRNNRKRRVALRTAEARAARRLRVPPIDLLDPIAQLDLIEELSA